MDYIAFCKNYYAATGIPTSLVNRHHSLYATITELLSIPPYRNHEIDPSGLDFPCLNNYNPDIEYGMVAIDGTDEMIVLGPIFGIRPTQDLIHSYMNELAIPANQREIIAEFLYTIPQISMLQFAKHLILIHQCINSKSCDLSHFFGKDFDEKSGETAKSLSAPEPSNTDENRSTYFYELELYELIRKGNIDELKKNLDSVPLNFNSNTMAKSSLRQAKNLFIKTATNAVMIGAIPGGVPIENAYALLDSYVQEMEKITSKREIEILSYNMMVELCQQTGKNQIPKGISAEVFQCMSFIRSHTHEPIGVEDVAATIGKSPSYVTKCFRKELDITPGAFINRCKLEEAKSLLMFTEKSLAEISSYLCYSSQAYFQNVFKKQFGMTPMQFRKARQRVN